jgi:hypothetical protein
MHRTQFYIPVPDRLSLSLKNTNKTAWTSGNNDALTRTPAAMAGDWSPCGRVRSIQLELAS